MREFFGFTGQGQYLDMTQRDLDAVFKTDGIHWGFEVSEGVRPADPFIPNRYLPIRKETYSEGYQRTAIIIPIGTIVSALPVFNREYYTTNASGIDGVAPFNGTTLSGQIALGVGYTSSVLSAYVDDNVEAFGDKINLAGTIANGGTSVLDGYSAYDTGRSRLKADGTAIGLLDTYARTANIPLGVVTDDILIDDRGQYLNFTENVFQRFQDMITDWFVAVPYVVAGAGETFNVTESGGTQTFVGAYEDVYKLGIPYLYAQNMDELQIGAFVSSDFNGKYVPQYTSGILTGAKTVQTVAKLMSLDNKFPKDLTELVQVYNESLVGGTGTYGIPHILFVFVHTILKNWLGTAPTYTQIVAAMNSGRFGMARMNLHVS